MSNTLKRMAAVLLTVASLGLLDCKSDISVPLTASPDIAAELLLYKQFSAKLNAVMTFESSGTAVTVPTELGVTAVPIEWMGLTFTGTLQNTGSGGDAIEQVHGTISEDGQWISSLTYSRKLTFPYLIKGSRGTQYTVALRNLPLPGGGWPNTLNIEQSGSEVQKYVVKITWLQGPMSEGQIVDTTRYLASDWKTPDTEKMPRVKLILSGQTGTSPRGTSAPQTGTGMGKP